jgi:ankyrin repeat/BTB/POZ domain-containing protein 1
LLAQIIDTEEFKELVIRDAAEVHKREDTDTIDIIDDIRHHITSTICTISQVDDANEKLRLIDDLLEDLGLDA